MTADLSNGCGNGSGWLVHVMAVSRIAQQLASDSVEPEALAQIAKVLCPFHLTSATCSANIENPTFPRVKPR